MRRNITVFMVVLASYVIAGFAGGGRSTESKPLPRAVPKKIEAGEVQPASAASRISIDYELRFAEEGQQPALVKMTLQGRTGNVVRTSVDGLENCKVQIETVAHTEGIEPYYVTSLNLVGKDDSERRPDRWFCPKLRSPAGMPATIDIAPYKFQATVRNLP
jgi:hypothetical protein